MPRFLKGSIIISFITNLIFVLVNAYKTSLLKRFADGISLCWKQSITHSILHNYLYKQPWYRYSLTYRIVFKLANLADKLMGGIFKMIRAMLHGSGIKDSFVRAFNMTLTDKCYFIGGLLISIPVGALVAGIALNSVTIYTLIMCWAMFFVGVMVVVVAIYGRDSILIKLVRGLLTALK